MNQFGSSVISQKLTLTTLAPNGTLPSCFSNYLLCFTFLQELAHY
jgi:hypothetical protein